MPEAPVITSAAVASTEHGDEGSTSEGSSIEPGEEPGDTRSSHRPHTVSSRPPDASGAGQSGHGAMLLSQLRRRR